jgi:ABC-2 type transport system permease protein
VKRSCAILVALLRIGFAEAVAYRAELLLWVLATTMPFVMMALFLAVASDAPLGRYGRPQIVTYFLVTLITRHLTSSWAAWQLARDIRQGVLSLRLLRPVHPLLSYAAESLTAIPLRMLVATPIFVVCLFAVERQTMSRQPIAYALTLLALAQAWLLSVGINLAVGCVSFFLESGVKLMDFVLVLFMLASGYLVPLDLFPPSVRSVLDVLPFRYQLALPVELVTGVYDADLGRGLTMCATQTVYVTVLFTAVALLWRRGVRRFEAFGG